MAGILADRVVHRPIAALQPRPGHPRRHPKAQLEKLARSIKRFGFLHAVLVDGENRILCGHGRVKAAQTLGYTSVPTLAVEGLNEAELRLYAVAENRLGELAEWDWSLLAQELKAIHALDVEIDLSLCGFELPEIEILLDGLVPGEAGPDPADEVPELDRRAPPISQLGDLWRLGRHRLLCGSALSTTAYQQVLDGRQAQLVFTDPPYNVPVRGHVSGRGQHPEFAMASGEMSVDTFTAFLATGLGHIAAHSANGAILFVCMDWRHIAELLGASRQTGLEYLNLCVWAKTNAGMGSLYRSQHELVFVLKNGTAPHVNNVQLGKRGRHRTNVWSYPGLNSFGPERQELLAAHPTVKPVALVADALLDCSRRHGLVLDPFAGSGTTLLAAERTGRVGRAIELDPYYVDVAVRRFRQVTGQDAIHAANGRPFTELEQERHHAAAAAPACPQEVADVG